jgi:hypothetical protein
VNLCIIPIIEGPADKHLLQGYAIGYYVKDNLLWISSIFQCLFPEDVEGILTQCAGNFKRLTAHVYTVSVDNKTMADQECIHLLLSTNLNLYFGLALTCKKYAIFYDERIRAIQVYKRPWLCLASIFGATTLIVTGLTLSINSALTIPCKQMEQLISLYMYANYNNGESIAL